MVRRRFVDPSQQSLFNETEAPHAAAPESAEPFKKGKPPPPPPPPPPEPPEPSGPPPKYPVYRPSRAVASVFAVIVGAINLGLQPEDPTTSYRVGVILSGLIICIVTITLFMIIPWPRARRVFRWCDTRRTARAMQAVFVALPLAIAFALTIFTVETAGDDIVRAFRETRIKLAEEAEKREWEKGTETIPAPREKAK